jgi:hypothetical protein
VKLKNTFSLSYIGNTILYRSFYEDETGRFFYAECIMAGKIRIGYTSITLLPFLSDLEICTSYWKELPEHIVVDPAGYLQTSSTI